MVPARIETTTARTRLARRHRGAPGVSAAALLIVLTLVAGCTSTDEAAAPGRSVGGASGPLDAEVADTVAMGPGREWLGVGRVALVEERPADVDGRSTAAFVRGDDPAARVAFVQRLDEPVPPADGHEPVGEPVLVEGWTGVTGVDELSGHRWLAIGRGPQHLAVWASSDVATDELIALATGIDLGRTLDTQKSAGPWRQLASSPRALDGATTRSVQVRRDDLGADLHLTTWVDVDDSAMSILGNATVADQRRVRGGPGLVIASPMTGDAVVTWREGPGLVAQARFLSDHRPGSERLVADAVEAVEGLTRLDPHGWKSLATRAVRYRPAPNPSADDADPSRVVFNGRFVDGRTYSVTERHDAFLCVTVEGNDGITRCDDDRQFWRGRSTQAMPRLLDPGDPTDARSPVLLYGYLPEIALLGEAGVIQSVIGPWLETGRAVSVHVADRRGRDLGWGTIVDDVWVHHVPDNDLPLVVTYRFRDGREMVVEPGPGRRDGEAQ